MPGSGDPPPPQDGGEPPLDLLDDRLLNIGDHH